MISGRTFPIICLCALLAAISAAQSLTVEEYDPKSTLKVAEHPVSRAKFPVIDVHSHHRGNTAPDRLDQIVKEMDGQNLQILVNLSGRNGEQLSQIVKNFKGRYPKRFVIFANLDFDGIDSCAGVGIPPKDSIDEVVLGLVQHKVPDLVRNREPLSIRVMLRVDSNDRPVRVAV